MICDRKVMKQDFNIIRIETSMDMGIGNRRKDWTYIEAEELLPGGVYNVHDHRYSAHRNSVYRMSVYRFKADMCSSSATGAQRGQPSRAAVSNGEVLQR